jgi:hypothetical protein
VSPVVRKVGLVLLELACVCGLLWVMAEGGPEREYVADILALATLPMLMWELMPNGWSES